MTLDHIDGPDALRMIAERAASNGFEIEGSALDSIIREWGRDKDRIAELETENTNLAHDLQHTRQICAVQLTKLNAAYVANAQDLRRGKLDGAPEAPPTALPDFDDARMGEQVLDRTRRSFAGMYGIELSDNQLLTLMQLMQLSVASLVAEPEGESTALAQAA